MAATACAAPSVFSDDQAAKGQTLVAELRAPFKPRPAVVAGSALESDAPLLTVLPREIVTAVLHHLCIYDLARFAATCRAFYYGHSETVVAMALQERAEGRSYSAAGPQEVPALLRREWLHALAVQPLLMASRGVGEVSAFIDSAGCLLTCGTEMVVSNEETESSNPTTWVDATADPEHTAAIRILASPTVVPAMREVRFRGVASGVQCCLAVGRNGKVYCWGWFDCHLGHDEEDDGAIADGLVDVRSVGAGLAETAGLAEAEVFAAVTVHGSLYTWGRNLDLDGRPSGIGYPVSLSDDELEEVPRQVILNGVCVRSVALGAGFSLILADDGRLFSCGYEGHGALGHGNQDLCVVRPKQIEALQGVHVCCVAADCHLSLAVSADYRVYAWGDGPQTGHDATREVLLPTLVEALASEKVSMVAAGGRHACAVTEGGALFTWGSVGCEGALGHGDESPQPTPRRVEALRGCGIASVATGDWHTLAAGEDGSVYRFGLSSRLGFGTVSHVGQLTPKRIPNLKVWLGGAVDHY